MKPTMSSRSTKKRLPDIRDYLSATKTIGKAKKHKGRLNIKKKITLKSEVVPRKSYTAAFKLNAVEYAKTHNNRVTATEFNVSESNVRSWKKQKEELLASQPSRAANRGSTPKLRKLEKTLANWVRNEISAQRCITGEIIRIKACALAEKLRLKNFGASPHWYTGFSHRFNLSEDLKAVRAMRTEPTSRQSFTAAFKLAVIEFAKEHNNNQAARHFNIAESNVRNWKKQENELLSSDRLRKANRGHPAKWPELEKSLTEWLKEETSKRHKVNSPKIRKKASSIAKEMDIQDFGGSANWCHRFLQRSGLYRYGNPSADGADDKTPTKLLIRPKKRYTNEYKLEILDYAKEHSMYATSKQYEINEANIRQWRKKEASLRETVAPEAGTLHEKERPTLNGAQHGKMWPRLEADVKAWIEREVTWQRIVNTEKIRKKASGFAEEMNITDFEATASWCYGFLHRHNLNRLLKKSAGRIVPLHRKTFTAHDQVLIVKYAKTNGNLAAAKKYGATVEKIREWRKARIVSSKEKWPVLEKKVAKWVEKQVLLHDKVTVNQLKTKTMNVVKQLDIRDFSASTIWCYQFLQRCNLFHCLRRGVIREVPPPKELKVDKLLSRKMQASKKSTSANPSAACGTISARVCNKSSTSQDGKAATSAAAAQPQVRRDFGSFHSSNLDEQIKFAESPSYVPPPLMVEAPKFEEYTKKTFQFGHVAKKKHFYLEEECTFLNHGAFGAVLKQVLDYSHEWQRYVEQQPLRFIDRLLFPQVVHVQKRLAEFVGCDTSDIVMVSNVTTATNAVLQSLDLDQDSTIYYLNTTYGSVKKVIKFVCERAGAKMQEESLVFPIENEKYILDLVDRTLKEGTTLAVFDHISSNHPFIMPVKELVLICHTKGVPVMIDGAHALGAVPLNLCYLGADYYTGNAHKWLCSAKGCGFLYVKQEKQAALRGLVVSHGHDAGFHSKFIWTGTKDYCAYLALHGNLNFWNAVGPDKIRKHCHELLVHVVELLQRKWNAELLAPVEMLGMLCCVSLPASFYANKPDISYSDGEVIQNRLYHEYNIEIPLKCIQKKLYVRLSVHVYNQIEDYEKLANAVLEIGNSMSG